MMSEIRDPIFRLGLMQWQVARRKIGPSSRFAEKPAGMI
mgnify:CR=1 FL=1|jgi:hypothetical protein